MIKSGYILNVVPGVGANTATTDCNGLPTHTKFYATAAPEILAYTGKRGFAATTTSTIWQNTAGTPPTEPITPSATVSVVGTSHNKFKVQSSKFKVENYAEKRFAALGVQSHRQHRPAGLAQSTVPSPQTTRTRWG